MNPDRWYAAVESVVVSCQELGSAVPLFQILARSVVGLMPEASALRVKLSPAPHVIPEIVCVAITVPPRWMTSQTVPLLRCQAWMM